MQCSISDFYRHQHLTLDHHVLFITTSIKSCNAPRPFRHLPNNEAFFPLLTFKNCPAEAKITDDMCLMILILK